MASFKRISLLFLLLVGVPGRGEAVGFHEVRDAMEEWHRVFRELPALEQFIREGKRPQDGAVQALEETLRELDQQETSNPFLPLARGTLFALTKEGSVRGEAAKASRLAGDRVAVRWLLYTSLLRLGEEEAADRELRQIREIRDRLGLDRIGYLGLSVASSAEAPSGGSGADEMEKAFALAAAFDPVAPEVYFARARMLLGRGSPRGFLPLVKGWWISLTSPVHGLSHWANMLVSTLFALPLLLLAVGLLLLLRVTPLLGHDLAEWRRRSLSPRAQAFLPIPVYLLPVILGVGLFPSLLLCLLPAGIYLRGRERMLWAGLILSLSLLPSGYGTLARMMTATISPRYVAIAQSEEGNYGSDTEAALRRWVKETPDDPLPRFYLGRMHRFRGEFRQGIAAYAEIPARGVQDAAVWTNRGNLAFLAGDLDQAKAAYEKAMALSPSLPYARFNLSQLLTERLLLENAQHEYARAIGEDPSLKARMQQAVADGRKRVLLDAPLPARELWQQVILLGSPSPETAEVLWGRRFLGVSLAHLPWVVGGYLVVFVGFTWFRGRRRFARACHHCGKVFCPRCQRLLGEVRLCTRCAIIERARAGEVLPVIKVIPADEGREEPRWHGWMLALIPGAGALYRGRTLWGFLVLMATLFTLTPLVAGHFSPETYFPGASLPYHRALSVLILVCMYASTALTYGRGRHGAVREGRWR